MIYDSVAQQWQEPLPEERERAMGYNTHATRHPAVTSQKRWELLGKAMDLRCLTWFMTLCLAFQMFHTADPVVALALTNWLSHPDLVHLPPRASTFHRFALMAGGGGPTTF